MESLGSILGSRQFNAPNELSVIKDYIYKKYKASCVVKIQQNTVVLSLPNSALAATIQLERQKLIKACNLTGKKLSIRTGN